MSLTMKSSDFYTYMCERNDNLEYYELIQRFDKKFVTELPEIALIGFKSARQGPSESLHD